MRVKSCIVATKWRFVFDFENKNPGLRISVFEGKHRLIKIRNVLKIQFYSVNYSSHLPMKFKFLQGKTMSDLIRISSNTQYKDFTE